MSDPHDTLIVDKERGKAMFAYTVFYTKDPDSRGWIPLRFGTLPAAAMWVNAQTDLAGVIIRRVDTDCERCQKNDPSDVPHFNCIYHGNAVGHCADHCTADACY